LRRFANVLPLGRPLDYGAPSNSTTGRLICSSDHFRGRPWRLLSPRTPTSSLRCRALRGPDSRRSHRRGRTCRPST